MKVRTYCAVVVALAAMCSAQQNGSGKSQFCDLKFCWSDNEISILATGWASTSKEKNVSDDFAVSNAQALAIRCLKNLHICIQAESAKASDLAGQDTLVTIDVMPVTQWDNDKVTFRREDDDANPCFRTSYIINLVDRSVLLNIDADRKSPTPLCTALVGKRKSMTYKLKQ